MTALQALSVLLCASLTAVAGAPAAKQPFVADDVLAGGEFLTVFMGGRRAGGPDELVSDVHHYDSDLNSVSQRAAPSDHRPYTLSNIYESSQYGFRSPQVDYQTTEAPVPPAPTQQAEAEARTTTQLAEPTTIDDTPTTIQFAFERISKEHRVTDVEPTTSVDTTTKIVTEKVVEEKVISVRVSSSVARHSHRTVETSTAKSVSEVRSRPLNENLVSTLVTQEQPTLTAVQRSDLGVEESAPSGPEAGRQVVESESDKQEEVEGQVREVAVFGDKKEGNVFEIHYHHPPAAMLSNLGSPEERRQEGETVRRKEFRQLSQFREPTSYQTRVSSPTSETRVKFYRDHGRGNVHGAAESVQQPVISEPFAPAAYRREEVKDTQRSIPKPYTRESYRIEENNQRQRTNTGSFATETYGEHKDKGGRRVINDNITPAAYRAEETQQDTHGESSSYHEEPSEKIYGEPEKIYGEPEKVYGESERVYSEPAKVYGEPEKVYGEPAKVYGEPSKVYSEPAKVYSEPAKVYSEPAKVYGEPAKIYSEPAKVYSEPAKVYSEPAKVYSEPSKVYGEPEKVYGEPEVNYEVDEAASVASNGKAHGPQTLPPPASSEDPDQNKFGYVVEGQNFRKYRVEERTADGFIVGEYGVVSHDDGSLRGVRYTADSTINPRLIYDTLVKFLSL